MYDRAYGIHGALLPVAYGTKVHTKSSAYRVYRTFYDVPYCVTEAVNIPVSLMARFGFAWHSMPIRILAFGAYLCARGPAFCVLQCTIPWVRHSRYVPMGHGAMGVERFSVWWAPTSPCAAPARPCRCMECPGTVERVRLPFSSLVNQILMDANGCAQDNRLLVQTAAAAVRVQDAPGCMQWAPCLHICVALLGSAVLHTRPETQECAPLSDQQSRRWFQCPVTFHQTFGGIHRTEAPSP